MTMTLEVMCPSTMGHEQNVVSWQDTMTRAWKVTVDATLEGEAAGYLQKVERFRQGCEADVIAYLHSDVTIHEHGWDTRVLDAFDDPEVAVVSFGGALRHGTSDIYKTPYDYRQLARSGWMSNLSDAELHGVRRTDACNVAVVDSFSLIVRRVFLDSIGGFPVATYPPSHCSDYWTCLMAHRYQRKVRFVGVACTHTSGGVHGDGTFDYSGWAAHTKWGSDEAMHQAGHFLIYSQFRDVLPVVFGRK